MAHTLQVQFEKVVDWFAMQLSDEEKKRLVTIYHLPRKYYEEYPIIVFQGLKMTGVFGYDNPEGLLDIAELLDRRDLFQSARPKLQDLKKQKGLRKTSTVVDLNMLYSAVDIGPAFEIAMKQIDVAQASSELLQRICKYRFREEPEKKNILCDRLKEVKKRLNEASDLLTLMGEEAVGTVPMLHTELKDCNHGPKYCPEQLPSPGVSILHPEIVIDDVTTHIYEVVHTEKKTALIPKVKITGANSQALHTLAPPKTLPKPKQTHQQKQQLSHPVNVKLDPEGYALPTTINSLPVKPPTENSGTGDSGIIEDWKGVTKAPYQQLLDKDKVAANAIPPRNSPPTPPPKPKTRK